MRFAQIATAACIALLAVVALAGAGGAAWQQSAAPEGGRVQTLVRGADGTVYAGTVAGVFTSSNGANWRPGGRFPGVKDDADVTSIATADGTTAYALVGGRLFRSIDAGATWRRIAGAAWADAEVVSVAASSDGPDVVYAGTWSPPRVYRSSDGGHTWSTTAYGREEGVYPNALVVDPQTADRVYVATVNGEWNERENGGVYMTDDGGSSWTPLSIGLPRETWIVSLALDPSDSGTVYAGTESRGVFKSSDGGSRWHRARTGLPTAFEDQYATVNGIAVDPDEPQVVYAGTSHGVAVSTDGGSNWSRQTSTSLSEVSSFVTGEAGTVLAGSLDRGVLRSTDRGAHWAPANAGLTAVSVMAIASDPSQPATVYLGTYESGLFRTTNAGRTWSAVDGVAPRNVRALAFDPRNHQTIYVGAVGARVLKSVDGGATWVGAGRGLGDAEGVEALAIDPRRPSTLYAATDEGVYRTVNRGTSWRRAGLVYEWISALALDPTRPTVLYASDQHESRYVFASKNAGKKWKRIPVGLRRGAGVRALAVSPKSGAVYAAADRLNQYGLSGDVGDGVYRLERGHKRWVRISAGLPREADGTLAGLRSIGVHPRTGVVYVATNRGLYRLARANDAARWQLANPLFSGQTVRRIAFDPRGSHVYAALPGRFLVSG